MPAKLYVVAASHPCKSAEAALRLKRLDYRLVEMPDLVHRPLQRRRFGAPTVPGIEFEDGERAVGSRAILRRLDERIPEPPLYPADPEQRARVEEAERWGDDVLQAVARRVELTALQRKPSALPGVLAESRFPAPAPLLTLAGGQVLRLARRVHGASDEAVRADLAALPDHLAHVDALIEEGVIGGEQPNAADLQIAASLALLAGLEDLAPVFAGRRCADLGPRLFPDYTAPVPAGAFPSDWIPAARRDAPTVAGA